MPNKPKFPSPRFGRRIADALSPRLSVPRVVTPWITVQDVDADVGTDSASTGSGGRSRAEALSAFRRRVSSSVSASMRVKKSNRSAGKAANPHPPPLRTRCKSVSFEVSLIILSDLKELLIRPCTQCVCFGCMIFVGIELTSGQRTINLSQ